MYKSQKKPYIVQNVRIDKLFVVITQLSLEIFCKKIKFLVVIMRIFALI